jgi:F-type H+-transporting ATPase subunit epsilon
MSFHCTVVTPEEQTFDAVVNQAIVPAHDGLIGLLTNRAPLLVKLGTGPLRLDLPNNAREFFFIDGGVAQMKDNRLTILTGEATASNEIDFEAAKAEFAEASARRAIDEKSSQEREHQLARARAKQEIARLK